MTDFETRALQEFRKRFVEHAIVNEKELEHEYWTNASVDSLESFLLRKLKEQREEIVTDAPKPKIHFCSGMNPSGSSCGHNVISSLDMREWKETITPTQWNT